jgi:ankyrin repeat protein
VAFHQEQLATFAIPRNLDSNEEADSGRAQGIRSASSLRSVALDFSDGDSSLDSDDRNVPLSNVDARLLDAARVGHEVVARLLLETGKVDVDWKGSDGRTPLSWATGNGHETVVRLLLETGKVDADSKDTDGQTPLSWAAANGHEAVVKLLEKAQHSLS